MFTDVPTAVPTAEPSEPQGLEFCNGLYLVVNTEDVNGYVTRQLCYTTTVTTIVGTASSVGLEL